MRLIPLLILLIYSYRVTAQESHPSLQNTSPYNEAIQFYRQFTGGESHIYYGEDYVPMVFATNKSFFISEQYISGSVWYKTKEAIVLPLRYDLFTHELMTPTKNGLQHVILDLARLDSFAIHGHQFVFLKKSPLRNLLHSGFYDRLYSGAVSLYCLRTKEVKSNIKGQRIIYHFANGNKYYVLKGGIYYRVDNKRDLLRVFSDEKKSVRKQIRKYHLRLRNNTLEEGLIKITSYYDQLQ